MNTFLAGHMPCSPAAGASFLSAQEIADEVFESRMSYLYRSKWEEMRNADLGTVTAFFETVSNNCATNSDKEAHDGIEKLACDLVRLVANGNELNEKHCRRAFGLLQRVLRDVADQWAREDGSQ